MLGGSTFETTIVEALDVLEADRFWTQAEVAVQWRTSLPADRRAERDARDTEVDAAFHGIA